MADYIEVNMKTLETDTGNMEEKLGVVKNDMKSMFDAVAELDTMWDGPASTEFQRQFNVDKQIFDEVCRAVEGMLDSMRNAIKSYNECEAAVSTEISRIKI